MKCYVNLFYIVSYTSNAFINKDELDVYAKLEACEHQVNLDNDMPLYNYMNVHTDKVSKYIQEDDKVKDLNNRKSTKDVKPIHSHCESTKRKKRSKPRCVDLRRDVVNKGIIRGLNRFYNKLFKFKTSYKDKTRDTLYNQFTSHVTQVFTSYQTNGDLSNLVQTNGKLGERLTDAMYFIRFIENYQIYQICSLIRFLIFIGKII